VFTHVNTNLSTTGELLRETSEVESQEHSSEVNEYYTVFPLESLFLNHLYVTFYSHQNVGLMGLSLIIQSPLNCDPEPPIGCLLSVRPRVD